MAKNAVKKPITYLYNPYLDKNSEVQMVEVLQVLEDEVLGKIYPWQYTAGAETSSRIETLNFIALKQFLRDSDKYDVKFVYRVSARILDEGNVQKLGEMLRSNLILCFDIYNLEKFGEKDSLMGINYLLKRGGQIMIEGNEKAPIEVIMKYPAKYFLLDNRYYNQDNAGILAMLKQIADLQGVSVAVYNVNNATNLPLYEQFNIDVMCGSYIAKPRKKLESLGIEQIERAKEDEPEYQEEQIVDSNDNEIEESSEIDEVTEDQTEFEELHAQTAEEIREEQEISEEELQKIEELKGNNSADEESSIADSSEDEAKGE